MLDKFAKYLKIIDLFVNGDASTIIDTDKGQLYSLEKVINDIQRGNRIIQKTKDFETYEQAIIAVQTLPCFCFGDILRVYGETELSGKNGLYQVTRSCDNIEKMDFSDLFDMIPVNPFPNNIKAVRLTIDKILGQNAVILKRSLIPPVAMNEAFIEAMQGTVIVRSKTDRNYASGVCQFDFNLNVMIKSGYSEAYFNESSDSINNLSDVGFPVNNPYIEVSFVTYPDTNKMDVFYKLLWDGAEDIYIPTDNVVVDVILKNINTSKYY